MPPDHVILERMASMEATLNAHFLTVERDREIRRDNERGIAERLEELERMVMDLKTSLETARMSGKLLITVAVGVGGLISWIIGLYVNLKSK